MPKSISKYGAVVMIVISVLASIALTVESLGHYAAILAIASAAIVTAGTTWFALRVASRQALSAYKIVVETRWQQEPKTPLSTTDHDFLESEVIPAFAHVGVDGTRRFFIKFLMDLNLPEERRKLEEEFINSVSQRQELPGHERIDLMVHHFADDG